MFGAGEFHHTGHFDDYLVLIPVAECRTVDGCEEDRQLGNIWTVMETIKEYLVGYTRIKRDNNHSNSNSGYWFLVLSLGLVYDLMCFNLFNLHNRCNVPVSERSKLRHGKVKPKVTC